MEDRIRGVGYSQPNHPEVFEEISKEFSPVESNDPTDTDVEAQEVEESDGAEFVTDQFREEKSSTEEDEFELGRTRERGWETKEIDFSDNVGVEFADGVSSLSEKVDQIETVNSQLEEKGVARRYVLGDPDAPESAHVYEDQVGKYYYKADQKFRPSHTTEVVDESSWFELSQKGRTLATVLLLSKTYPWVFDDANTETAVQKFLDRVLVTEVDELEKEDVFSVERVEEIRNTLLDR